MPWKIDGVQKTETSPGRDTVDAALVTVTKDGDERRIVVELAGTAAATGKTLDAREAVRDWLNDDEPPKRIIVGTYGPQPSE